MPVYQTSFISSSQCHHNLTKHELNCLRDRSTENSFALFMSECQSLRSLAPHPQCRWAGVQNVVAVWCPPNISSSYTFWCTTAVKYSKNSVFFVSCWNPTQNAFSNIDYSILNNSIVIFSECFETPPLNKCFKRTVYVLERYKVNTSWIKNLCCSSE